MTTFAEKLGYVLETTLARDTEMMDPGPHL